MNGERSIFTVLGGGSAYTPGLVSALIHHAAELPLTEVRLFDIDSERLAVVERLTARMATSQKAPFRVVASSTLNEAVAGASFVLQSSRPGGLSARRLDETLPLELGLPGQETVGPGGFFFALRSVPEAMRVAAALREHAPSSVLLNYTNPTNIVTQALCDHGGVQVLGLCDQSDEDLMALREAFHLGDAPYSFDTLGLNHATFYTNIKFGGAPLPPLSETLVAPSHFDEEHKLRFAESLAVARRAGAFPNSYLPYYLRPELFVAHSRKVGPRSDVIRASLPDYYAHFAEEADKPTPKLLRHRGTAGFGDMAVRVVAALCAAEPVRLVLNVPNAGASPLFAATTVIEQGVCLSQNGVSRAPAPDYPASHRSLILRLEDYQRATVEAALSGDFKATVDALAQNPLVPDRSVAEALLARARGRYGALLPMFS